MAPPDPKPMIHADASEDSTLPAADRFHGRPVAFYVAFTVATIALGIAWGLHHLWRPATYILTPHRNMAPLTPVYGFFDPSFSWFVLPSLLILIAVVLFLPRLARRGPAPSLLAALLFTATFWFSVHAVREGMLPGREFLTYPSEDVIFDVPRIESAAAFLHHYTRLQPGLSLHGRTKPPGFALLHYGIKSIFGDHVLVVGSLLTLLASLIVVPAYFIGRGLRGRPAEGTSCAILTAAVPAAAAFGALSLDAVYAVVAAGGIAVSLAETNRRRWTWRVGLGLLLALGMMLSYATFLVGFFCGCLIILKRYRRPVRCVTDLLTIGLAFVLPLLLLRLTTGFDAWTAFSNARAINETLMTGIVRHSLAGIGVWSYVSIGNLLAFLIYLGPAAIACWALRSWRDVGEGERSFALAFTATLLVASFGGLFLMETERILLFLVPAAVALALPVEKGRLRAVILLTGLQVIAMELFILTLW